MFFSTSVPTRLRSPAPHTTAFSPARHPVGSPLVLTGRIHDDTGRGVRGVSVQVRRSDNGGTVRAGTSTVVTVTTDDDGCFTIATITPAPYQIPADGPTGWFIANEGWNPWRPAHLHVTVKAPRMRILTTRLYFRRDAWIRHDAPAKAILDPRPGVGGIDRATIDFTLERSTSPVSGA